MEKQHFSTALFISSQIKMTTKFYQTLFYNTLYAYFYIFLFSYQNTNKI